MDSFTCPWCQKTHIVPEHCLNLCRDYPNYCKGVIHNEQSEKVLICDGYDWYDPKTHSTHLGDEYQYRKGIPGEQIRVGDHVWMFWHGYSGGWFAAACDFILQDKNAIIAFKCRAETPENYPP